MGQEGELERRQGIRWKRCVEDASFYLLGQSCVRFTPWVQSLDEFSEQTHSQACPSDVILGNGGELPNVMEAQVALVVKNLPTNIGDVRDSDSIPGSGRSPGRGHGNPLQYSCLENPHGQRSLAGCSPWGHKELDMTTTKQSTVQHSVDHPRSYGHLGSFRTVGRVQESPH